MKKTLFVNVITKGLSGAMIGLLGGLILGMFIALLSHLTAYIDKGLLDMAYVDAPPTSIFSSLGMSFGSLIGAIFGCIAGFKESK